MPAEKVRAQMNKVGEVRSCSRSSGVSGSMESGRMRGAEALLVSSSMAHSSMGWDAVLGT